MDMLAGQALGQALERAMEMKGVGPSALARQFEVTPSSVGDWRKRGCIHKRHLGRLVAYFSDVVPASHWGLTPPDGKQATPPIVGTRMMSHGIFAVEGDWRRIEATSDALERQLARVDVARFSPMAIELAREFDAIRDDQRQMEAFVKCMAIIAKAQV
jgi:hypothetical protein